ncbi:hypothetical protein HJFPF1_07641 [Paramyrothecium foliicola]|nr:hypothetical protein HJFPF1_07641 [Paramyrothecium foliicola]
MGRNKNNNNFGAGRGRANASGNNQRQHPASQWPSQGERIGSASRQGHTGSFMQHDGSFTQHHSQSQQSTAATGSQYRYAAVQSQQRLAALPNQQRPAALPQQPGATRGQKRRAAAMDEGEGANAANPVGEALAQRRARIAGYKKRDKLREATMVSKMSMDVIVDSATGDALAVSMSRPGGGHQGNMMAPSKRGGIEGFDYSVNPEALPDFFKKLQSYGKGQEKVIGWSELANDAKFKELKGQEGTERLKDVSLLTQQYRPLQSMLDTAGFGDDVEDYRMDEDSEMKYERPLTEEQRREREEDSRRYVEEQDRSLRRIWRSTSVSPEDTRTQLKYEVDDSHEGSQKRPETRDSGELSDVLITMSSWLKGIKLVPEELREQDTTAHKLAVRISPMEKQFADNLHEFQLNGTMDKWHCLDEVYRKGSRATRSTPERSDGCSKHGKKCYLVVIRDINDERRLDFST